MLKNLINKIIFYFLKDTLRRTIHNPIELEIRNLKFQIGSSYFDSQIKTWPLLTSLETIEISNFEYKVFSQWGHDGVIQFLINYFKIDTKTFIEFGSSNYLESNTRFLLQYNNWDGLIMDGDKRNIDLILNDEISWKYNLIAITSFITKENINQTIKNAGFEGEIGVLNIDIDGNDYYVWDEINVVTPKIVIIEFNALFGNSRTISVPYDPAFDRNKFHFSELLYGASYQALKQLGEKKGYTLVYCSVTGNDMFFVRNDIMKNQKNSASNYMYKTSKFRIGRNEDGSLAKSSSTEILKKVDIQIYNTTTNLLEKLNQI